MQFDIYKCKKDIAFNYDNLEFWNNNLCFTDVCEYIESAITEYNFRIIIWCGGLVCDRYVRDIFDKTDYDMFVNEFKKERGVNYGRI